MTLRRQPFTLLEVIVVTALLTAVILAAVLGVKLVMDSYDRLTGHSRRFQEQLTLDRTAESCFGNLIPFQWRDDTGNRVPVFVGETTAVTFAYLHPLNRLEDGAIRFARLVVEDGELVCYYCERPPFPEDLASPRLRRSVLARDVAAVIFAYADLESDVPVLVEDWGDRLHTPLAIRMRVEWTDGTTQTWLYRTGGSGLHERWGRWQQEVRTQ